jgi:predicted nuclease with TOPRIM domain
VQKPETSARLKQLRRRVLEAKSRAKSEKEELVEVQSRYNESAKRARELEKQIKLLEEAAKKKEPVVSEHAMLRYLERVRGVDMEEVKQQILTEQLCEWIQTVGSGIFPGDQFKVRVRNGVVVTLWTEE